MRHDLVVQAQLMDLSFAQVSQIALEMGYDVDDLLGKQTEYTRELVLYFNRRGNLSALAKCVNKRLV